MAARALSMAFALLAAACGGEETPPPPPATTCPVPLAVATPTFSGDVLPVLRSSCGAGSAATCHGGSAPPGHVSWDLARTAMEVHADLVDVEPANAPPGVGWRRIAPFDVTRSWLVEKVTKDAPGGSGYGARMPYSLPNLCEPTVRTIEAWIERGAPAD